MSIIIHFDKTEGFNEKEWNRIVEAYRDWEGKGEIEFRRPLRTPKQNKALHLYCEWLASELRDRNMPFVEQYLNNEFERSWTMDLVKEKIFKPILKSISGKTSTARASTKEICDVADYIEKNLALKLGIDLAWPSREDLELENSNGER